jgi:hypothetical protein
VVCHVLEGKGSAGQKRGGAIRNGTRPSVPLSMFSASISPRRGFHTTYSISLVLPDGNCTPYLLFHLPQAIFPDLYQLSHLYSCLHTGTIDLESPLVAVHPEPSALLLNLSGSSHHLNVHVPLHARYPPLTALGESSYHDINIPWPVAFFACPACKSF